VYNQFRVELYVKHIVEPFETLSRYYCTGIGILFLLLSSSFLL